MIELPPRPLLEKLGRELRVRLVCVILVLNCTYLFHVSLADMASSNLQGLRLFNIDMIRELGTKDRYYIIDINYFPGAWLFCYLVIHTLGLSSSFLFSLSMQNLLGQTLVPAKCEEYPSYNSLAF